MDMLFENADFQNDIFLREHQTALKNLHNCLTITSNLMADLQNLRHEIDHKRKQECIQLYESTMKILTSFSEIFRQFNIEIQTTSFKLDANVRDCGGGNNNANISTVAVSGGGSGGGNSGNTVVTNGYGNHSYDDTDIRLKEFIYPKYDISIYKESYIGDGVVAYVEDSDKKLCFIIDAERAYDQNLYDTLGMELNRLPLPGEVFGIDLGSDGIFRAVRDNNVNIKRKQKTMKILLIDTGEIVESQPDTRGKFALSESAQKIPGRSIRCKVEEIFEEDGVSKSDETTLNHILYESMRFRVTKVHNNLLYIKVYRKGSGRFEELTCNTNDTLNGEVYKNASTLNPFATEFSFKYLNNTPTTFYSYQNPAANIVTNVDSSPTHQVIDDYNHIPNHSISYVINQNCPPLSNTVAAPLPLSATVEYPEYIAPHTHPMVVHHSSPPIPLQTVPTIPNIQSPISAIQTIQSVPQSTMQYYPTTNVVELFPDVYQNDETSFRETNLGKYDSSSTIKRMQNHLMSGGACFVPASSPTGIGNNKHDANCHRTDGVCSPCSADSRSSQTRPVSLDSTRSGGGIKTRTPVADDDDNRAGTDSPYDTNDHSESSDSLSIGANYNRPKPKRDVNDLTKEQLDELYEEPLGTENALKAVMGYVPKDDRRICRHYDPKLKGCFKGHNCKLEHVLPIKDGWTRDRAQLKMTIPAKLPMPSINQQIMLIPTYIVSVEEFYAQIPQLAVKSGMSLIKLNEAINSAENRNRYKRYTKPPGECELVLATYKSNYIYRAKVLEVDDNSVKVFYVDYGNCGQVALRNVFLWEDRWDHIPFQAYRCRMHGIKELKENDTQSTRRFKSMIYNKRLKAIIKNNNEDLYVCLLDDDELDIGDKLVQQNMAKQGDIALSTDPKINGLPG